MAALSEQIVDALQRREARAALVLEISTSLRPVPDSAEIDEALARLSEQGAVLVVDHAPPDVHLESTDLRVVACVPAEQGEQAAVEAADTVWNDWLRAFLSTHRCQ